MLNLQLALIPELTKEIVNALECIIDFIETRGNF